MNTHLSSDHVNVLSTYNAWLNQQSLRSSQSAETQPSSSSALSLPRLPPPSLQGAGEPIYNSISTSLDAARCPPPYSASDADLPSYTEEDEPNTLARSLFFYGFRKTSSYARNLTSIDLCPLVLPLFWIFGACMLFSKLEPTPSWEEGKTEAAKAHLLELMRRAERRWARRCLFALFGLSVAAVLVVLIVKFSILSRP